MTLIWQHDNKTTTQTWRNMLDLRGHYNEKDGHTYFKRWNGQWIAYPTFKDKSLDLDGIIHCDDMDGSSNHGMSEEDKAQMWEFIASIEGR